MVKKTEEAVQVSTEEMINKLVSNASKALDEYMKLDQEQVDKIAKAMALAGLSAQTELAKMAVEETGRGIFEDKVTKNIFSTEYIWHSIKYEKTVGVIEDNVDEGYLEIGEPVGIVAGVTPVTNPTSTTMFKSIICAKTRNPIIFGFHPNAQKCSVRAAEIVRDAAIAAGAPEYCVQWIETPSIEATGMLMNHPDVATILATGGPGMVRAASFIYCGLRNGYGYRDTVQDIQGIIHLAPEMAADKIRFMLSAQVANGGGLPLVKFTHNAGHEDTPDDASYVQETGHPAYRADDALWLFPTVYKYILSEMKDRAFHLPILPLAAHLTYHLPRFCYR